PVRASRPRSTSDSRLRSTRVGGRLVAKIRLTKSGPGRCRCDFGIVSHLCSRKLLASVPRIDSSLLSEVAVAVAISSSFRDLPSSLGAPAPLNWIHGGAVNGRAARLIVIGVVTGLAGGLLGVGGGFVMVPAMVYLLKTPQREANGTSLAVIVPVALVGATVLSQGHQVDVEVAIALAIGAVGGAVVGARLTRRVSDAGLRRAFGILAVLVGLLIIGEAVVQALGTPVHFGASLRPSGFSLWVLAFMVGVLAGVLSGLLGIGGGAIMIPAMTLLMGLSQHLAQGTSLL